MQEYVADLYKVLGVGRSASQSQMEEQYHREHLALQASGQSTNELELAYAVLTDVESRKEYDQLLGEDFDSHKTD